MSRMNAQQLRTHFHHAADTSLRVDQQKKHGKMSLQPTPATNRASANAEEMVMHISTLADA